MLSKTATLGPARRATSVTGTPEFSHEDTAGIPQVVGAAGERGGVLGGGGGEGGGVGAVLEDAAACGAEDPPAGPSLLFKCATSAEGEVVV